MTFAEIIHPISIEDFFENYYEKKPLHISRNQTNYYHDFIHPSELDIHLQLKQTYSPNVKVVRNGEQINPFYYSYEQKTVGPFIANPKLLLEEYKKGSTLKYDKLHLTYPPIARKTSALEEELQLSIRTSVYMTPKNSVGYGLHTDRHDIFALQINGCKIWNVQFAEEILPSTYGTNVEVKWNEKEIQRIELKSGDLFYCPRGLAHEVFTENESSIHFTIGLQPIYGYKIIENLSDLAYNNLFFKKAIPNAYNKNENYEIEFKQELMKIIENLSVEEIINQSRQKNYHKKLNIFNGNFLGEIYEIGKDDELKVASNWTVDSNKYACIVKIQNNTHNFPINLLDTFNKIKNAQKIKLAEIETNLSSEHHSIFLKRLINLKILC